MINSLAAILLGSWGTAGVGCFFLISGYFMWNSKQPFKVQKLLILIVEVELYVVAIYLIDCFLLQGSDFSLKSMIFIIGTPIFMNYWYLTVYLLLYILTPFLAKAVQRSTEVLLFRLLIILTIIIPVYRFMFSSAPVSYLGYGIYVWLIGAYWGKYGTEEKCRKAKKVFSALTSISVFILLACYSMNRLYDVDIEPLLSKVRGIISPFQVSVSIWLFLIFKDLRISYNYWINKLASATLAIYLIHMNSSIRELLFDGVLQVSKAETQWYFIFHCIISCISVYFIIAVIDFLRSWIFERISMNSIFLANISSAIDGWFY